MPPDIPGFYYDQERGRYFKVTSTRERPTDTYYHKLDIKKRKFEAEKYENAKYLQTERHRRYQEFILKLADPLEIAFGDKLALQHLNGLRTEKTRLEGAERRDITVNSAFGLQTEHHDISSNIVSEDSSSNRISLVFSASGKVFHYQSILGEGSDNNVPGAPFEQCLLDLNEYCETFEHYGPMNGFETVKLEGERLSPGGLYLHAQKKGSNIHIFACINASPPSRKVVSLKFKSNEDVHDSLNMGQFFVVAVGPKLRAYRWKDEGACHFNEVLNNKDKSEILTLAIDSSNQKKRCLYAGCRNGSIALMNIESKNKFQYGVLNIYRPPKVQSIMTIKCTDVTGLIIVSVVSQGSSVIYMLDMMLAPKERILVMFKTTATNLTKGQELFEISADGRYILYGSSNFRDGRGGFELFSSHQEDNLIYEHSGPKHAGPLFYYPTWSTDSNSIGSIELHQKKMRAVSIFKTQNSVEIGRNCVSRQLPKPAESPRNSAGHGLIMILEDLSPSSEFYSSPMQLISINKL